MFSKILIANRGEIACRVMATARRLGIRSVAVYSEADREAQHTLLADEAVLIGPAPSLQSYLRGDRIIESALATGAEAIHPGYGFLSENPDFVEAVEAAGLTFIGPSASAMRAMGLKDKAKQLMIEAGVPVVPGYQGEAQDPDFLAEQAEAIGYPVLIKARAGGGGKGMRLVESPADFREALQAARREGEASFGDPHCLIEKFIQRPRHIEVQVFGDAQGQVVHLFERDCSMQRRHQKIIEEAPAPGLDEPIRQAICAAAVKAAEAIDYQGAGTIEFIVDGSDGLRADGFWFMEMNTRLQVEHPVTEAITGQDLVEWQLRVAAGQPLPLRQDQIQRRGHAIEARLCAEDPTRGFLPATGRLERWALAGASAFGLADLRLDSGVVAGKAISPYYDPMIAKLIAFGDERDQALGRLTAGLAALEVEGVTTNASFLNRLLRSEAFAGAELDTGLVERDLEALIDQGTPSNAVAILAAVAFAGGLPTAERGADPWAALSHWRALGSAKHSLALDCNGQSLGVALELAAGGARVDGRAQLNDGDWQDFSLTASAAGGFALECGGRIARYVLTALADGWRVLDGADAYTITQPLGWQSAEAGDSSDTLLAPMPGLVQQVLVDAGQSVEAGQALAILEAMKMEHSLKAPRAATIAAVAVSAGDQVSDGQVLIQLEPEAESAGEAA